MAGRKANGRLVLARHSLLHHHSHLHGGLVVCIERHSDYGIQALGGVEKSKPVAITELLAFLPSCLRPLPQSTAGPSFVVGCNLACTSPVRTSCSGLITCSGGAYDCDCFSSSPSVPAKFERQGRWSKQTKAIIARVQGPTFIFSWWCFLLFVWWCFS